MERINERIVRGPEEPKDKTVTWIYTENGSEEVKKKYIDGEWTEVGGGNDFPYPFVKAQDITYVIDDGTKTESEKIGSVDLGDNDYSSAICYVNGQKKVNYSNTTDAIKIKIAGTSPNDVDLTIRKTTAGEYNKGDIYIDKRYTYPPGYPTGTFEISGLVIV